MSTPSSIPLRFQQNQLSLNDQSSVGDIVTYLRGQQQAIDRLWDNLARFINERHGAGNFVDRPEAGVAGRFYLATDTNPEVLYADDGVSWQAVYTRGFNAVFQVTVSGAATSGVNAFAVNEPDAFYTVSVTPVLLTGAPAAGSNRVSSVVKANNQLTVNVEAAPGVGNSVTFDVILAR